MKYWGVFFVFLLALSLGSAAIYDDCEIYGNCLPSQTISTPSNDSINLSDYVPYTGATGQVQLGIHGISGDTITFNEGTIQDAPATSTDIVNLGYLDSQIGNLESTYRLLNNSNANNHLLMSGNGDGETQILDFLHNQNDVPFGQAGSDGGFRFEYDFDNGNVLTIQTAAGSTTDTILSVVKSTGEFDFEYDVGVGGAPDDPILERNLEIQADEGACLVLDDTSGAEVWGLCNDGDVFTFRYDGNEFVEIQQDGEFILGDEAYITATEQGGGSRGAIFDYLDFGFSLADRTVNNVFRFQIGPNQGATSGYSSLSAIDGSITLSLPSGYVNVVSSYYTNIAANHYGTGDVDDIYAFSSNVRQSSDLPVRRLVGYYSNLYGDNNEIGRVDNAYHNRWLGDLEDGDWTTLYGIRHETQTIDGGTLDNLYSIYLADQSIGGNNNVGIWIEKYAGTNPRAIVLDGDGDGADLWLGDAQDSRIYFEDNIILESDKSGSGTGDVNTTKNLNVDGCLRYWNGTAEQTLGTCK